MKQKVTLFFMVLLLSGTVVQAAQVIRMNQLARKIHRAVV
jgi:hypothetical protein